MDFTDYQQQALATDQVPGTEDNALIVPLLGLAGEAGTLLSEYKKFLRDGSAHQLHTERVAEELGDLLWYISNVATKYQLDLGEVAKRNLAKVHGRWTLRGRIPAGSGGAPVFDANFPPAERLPRQFEVDIVETNQGTTITVQGSVGGVPFGQPLTDNAHDPDGYRFHDVFHLAYAAVLGWSPVTRSLLKRKRKSIPAIDEVEDGGRAIAIEEGITALVFEYARVHDFLQGVTALDETLLRTVLSMTSRWEVASCSAGDWETAMLQGYDAWRGVLEHHGGHLLADLDRRTITFRPA